MGQHGTKLDPDNLQKHCKTREKQMFFQWFLNVLLILQKLKKDMKKNKYLKDFEYISSSHNPEIDLSTTRMDSSSILNYLNNSIYFFKQSVKYISNFNSI